MTAGPRCSRPASLVTLTNRLLLGLLLLLHVHAPPPLSRRIAVLVEAAPQSQSQAHPCRPLGARLNLILSTAIRSAAANTLPTGGTVGMPAPRTSAAAAIAAVDGTSADAGNAAIRRRSSLSGGGSRIINQALSSDEADLQKHQLELLATRGGGQAEAAGGSSVSIQQIQRQHVLSSLLAGVGSGALASVVCAPLDLIRTRMQVMGDISIRARGAASASSGAAAAQNLPSLSVYRALTDILKQDGIRGCFRGLGATLATVPAFWGLYFPLYEHLKKELHGWYMKGSESEGQLGPCPPIVHMGSAIIAGAAADIVCNPMFLVRTRMQTEALHYFEVPAGERTPHGVWKTIRTVYAEGGVPAFWRGVTASLMGLGHVAIQFPVYEFLKAEARAKSPTNEETPADLLVASGVSKMCASLLTYPHEVIRSRMMDARGGDAGLGAVKTVRRILAKEGWGSMYTGIHVSLLRVVPNCCITFMSYELILRWAKENMQKQ